MKEENVTPELKKAFIAGSPETFEGERDKIQIESDFVKKEKGIGMEKQRLECYLEIERETL